MNYCCSYIIIVQTIALSGEFVRLIVIAEKSKVHEEFPIPLINRLEKHYVSATTLLDDDEKKVKQELETWMRNFAKPDTHRR